MRRKMISVSTALALMLSVAGCQNKNAEETIPSTIATTTTEAVNATAEDTTAAPVATEAPVATTEAPPAETDTAPETLHTTIPITSEYFPNENFRAYVSKEFDLDHDDVLSSLELQNATWINIDSIIYNINDLTGIEYLENLEYLSCERCSLSNLDISKNTKLVQLYCGYNQLSTLDLSHNTSLERVHCFGNPLVTLNLESNEALKDLSCFNTPLSSLDVSKCTHLEFVAADEPLTIIGAINDLQIEPHRHMTIENGLINEGGNLKLKDGVYSWFPEGVTGDPTHENFSGVLIENGFVVFHGPFSLTSFDDNFRIIASLHCNTKLARLPLDEQASFWGTGGTLDQCGYDADDIKALFYDDYAGLDCVIYVENGKITQINAAS